MVPAAIHSRNPAIRRKFQEIYSFYIPEAHRSFYSSDDLELFLGARFDFVEHQPPAINQLKLRAYNPPAEFFWLVNSTIVEVLMPDSRFIIDTLIDYCGYRGFRINLILHPVLGTQRDPEGHLLDVRHCDDLDVDADWALESCVYLEISRLDQKGIREVEKDLRTNIAELRTVVNDFPQMASALGHCGPEIRSETDWLLRHFILLGLAEVPAGNVLSASPRSRLGIFRHPKTRAAVEAETQYMFESYRTENPASAEPPPFFFRETEVYSNVNRRKPYYLVWIAGSAGRLLVAGHFASGAELQLRPTIPFLGPHLAELAEGLHAGPTSYTRKKILQIAQMIPLGLLLTRTHLFQTWMNLVLASEYADELEYTLSEDPHYRSVWIAAIVPGRDATQIPGRELERLLKEHGIETRHDIRYNLNRNRFVLLALRWPEHDVAELRAMLEEQAGRVFSSWSVRFRRLIGNKYVGDNKISDTLNRFFRGIAPDYEHHQSPEEALVDLDTLEKLSTDLSAVERYRVNFYSAGDTDFVKIYTVHRARFSEIVPTLSNFGFGIFEEFTLPYRRAANDVRYTYAFRVAAHADLDRPAQERIARAIERALNRESVPQALDALAIGARLDPRELDLLKALLGYYFQVERGYSRLSLQATLLKYPDYAARLVALFHARLQPATGEVQDAELAACKAMLEDVESIVDETLLRNLLRIVLAIVRTTYYLDRPEIAFKIDTHTIDFLPPPVPYFEIYVYAYDMEGTHLRGGAVARGGLRWSDRSDDFRTEVLGLMKAQMVKNTVIVPVGSKGGFIIKNRGFADRAQYLAAGVDTYRRYISALLDLTDSLTPRGKAIPAPGIHRRDGDDPYLVVAADKGTATFSDIANQISLAKKFWLTDAFASGGANGYDHKKQGITAKGAWEAVRRHFYELGQDPQRDAIRVVGIGDMSGDVFGNGMLLSRSILLVAAFNHLYIFLDPNPDPVRSFAERERLFQATGNWDAYNVDLISKGGGVYERASKRIALSPEARTVLGVKEHNLSGEELIRAILRAPVDLLWNGGIGTYVKASGEDNFAARDPANDRVRVNGRELRAKVAGEGGNLGFTQAGRIEAAERGMRLNTDAIDNSAGVNMSDHEVNLKIFLDQLLRKKQLPDRNVRNALIRKFDPAMIRLVLKSNTDINLGLSLDALRTPHYFSYLRVLIKNLNRAGYLNREHDNIPFEADLDQMQHGNRTVLRPVLCSLMGFTKLQLSQIFLASEEFHDPWYDRFILRYFPAELSRDYEAEIKRHPLKREIVITEILNDIVNHAGIASFQRMKMRTETDEVAIARAYIRFSEFANLARLRGLVGDSFELPVRVYYEYQLLLEEKVFSIVRRLVEDKSLIAGLDREQPEGFRQLLESTRKHSNYRLPRELRTEFRQLNADLQAQITGAFQQIDVLEDTFAIFQRQMDSRAQPAWTAADYFRIVENYRIDRLRSVAADLPHESNWEILFYSRIENAIERLLFQLLASAPPTERVRRARRAGSASVGDSAEAARNGRSDAGGEPVHREILATVEQILATHSAGTLNAAAFFEMLEHMRTRCASAAS